MSELALPGSIEPAARKGPDLGGAINPITGIVFGGIIAAVLLFVAYSIYTDIGESGTNVTSYAPFLLLFVALLIARRLRVRQRLSRYRKRCCDRHLYALASGKFRCGVVGNVQPGRRSGVIGRGGLRHYLALTRRADPAGRQQRGLCDGFRAPDCSDYLEPRHLGFWAAGIEFAHPSRFHHRRRGGECAAARSRRASIGRKQKR